jgi:predicted Zn-dependent protease
MTNVDGIGNHTMTHADDARASMPLLVAGMIISLILIQEGEDKTQFGIILLIISTLLMCIASHDSRRDR